MDTKHTQRFVLWCFYKSIECQQSLDVSGYGLTAQHCSLCSVSEISHMIFQLLLCNKLPIKFRKSIITYPRTRPGQFSRENLLLLYFQVLCCLLLYCPVLLYATFLCPVIISTQVLNKVFKAANIYLHTASGVIIYLHFLEVDVILIMEFCDLFAGIIRGVQDCSHTGWELGLGLLQCISQTGLLAHAGDK